METGGELRAREEERLAVVTGADAVAHTRVERGHSRALTTVFGTVTVERMAHRAPGAANPCPADATLNLPTEKHSHGLRRLAAIEATRGSFDDATAAIDRATGVRLGKRQAEALARAAAMDVEAFYAAGRPQPAPVHRTLVLTVDGKGIVMRPEALREATAKAAAAKGTKPAPRLSPGEKAGRKRMAEVGAVYAEPVPRTPEGIITAGAAEPQAGPVAVGKWLITGIAASTAEVIAAVFDEAV